jgi:EmrB/QacA subfamily drug resistance transporter
MATRAVVPAADAAPFRMRTIIAPLVAIIIGVFMVVLDSTAVNVAVPGLVRDFRDSLTTIQWTITGYALAQAAGIPLAGWLSDRYGARKLFLTSIVLFTIGSVLCATAQSSTMLIFFRVLQGLGGGFVIPVGMAYVYRLAPPERVGAVMGMMGIPILFAPAIGPVVAGWLVQYADWRWIFLLNLPVGIVGVFAGLRGLPRLERLSAAALDLPGLILGPLAFVALSYGVTQGSASWTSYATLGGIIVGVLALVAFTIVELRAENPLLELRVFKSFDFSLAIVVQWVGQFALFGALFLVPLFLQNVRHFGAFDTGLSLLPEALSAAVFMPIGGMLFDRIGARPLVIAGSAIMAVASFMLATIGITTQGRDLIVPLILYGAGMGLMMMTINTQLINSAPRQLVGKVTSLTNALQQVVSSLTIAGLTTILTARPSYHQAQGLVAEGPSHAASAAGLFSSAFDDTFHLIACAAILGAVLGVLVPRRLTAKEAEAAGDEPAPETYLMAS